MKIGNWKKYYRSLIVKEISTFSRYYDKIVQWKILDHDDGSLLERIECKSKQKVADDDSLPDLSNEADRRTIILLNGTFNYSLDIQELLTGIKKKLSRFSRVVVVAYNPYFQWLYQLANLLKLRKARMPVTFMTRTDLVDIAKISGYDLIRIRPTAYFPFCLFGLGSLINWLFPVLPFIKSLCFASVIILRPVKKEETKPSLSIIIPARNEKGNIENSLIRMPDFDGAHIEVIFVEGHSRDNTWEEIQRVADKYSSRFKIKLYQQTGIGKNDAVRLGFAHASCDLLTILDADLTMPPELLKRYYDAYCGGLADFINGSRLVYPMEGDAMRFLNRLGNIFFAKVLSSVLGTRIGDSLCGTKLLPRHDYNRIVKWREDFGEFDPFGDFELLFPSAIMGLGIIDIPIRYRSRVYGSTSINRFSHGLMLLKMAFIGLLRVRTGRIR